MTKRRSFLAGSGSALAGLMFCGCGLMHAKPARAQAPGGSISVADAVGGIAAALPESMPC